MSSDRGCCRSQLSCFFNCLCRRNSDRDEADAVREVQPFVRELPPRLPTVKCQKGINEAEASKPPIVNIEQEADAISNFSFDDSPYYKMNNARRGTALIFNHMYFSENSSREGTNKDRNDLALNLKKLGFEVQTFDNLTTKKVFQELYRVAALKHFDSDCLVVTVMTHGSREWLYSYDGAYALKDMTSLFNDENCPSLKGKPRLFFIQACRGSKADSGFTVPGSYNYVKSHLEQSSETDAARMSSMAISSEILPELELEKEFVHNQPAFDDFIIVRSTMIDYYSFRNPKNGSWFIQDLCRELEIRGTKCDFLSLLVYVNWAVSERESFDVADKIDNLNKKKITICTTSKLKKILQFDVKSQSNGASAKNSTK